MKILVIGLGGREHALVWKISQSQRASGILCAPGNPGIEELAECVPVQSSDIEGLLDLVEKRKIDLTVVGPEQPLADGIVDRFRERGYAIFGPSRDAAELEWSKRFAKDFMKRHSIPTAGYEVFAGTAVDDARRYIRSGSGPLVLKADGLAAGKGVLICNTREEAEASLQHMTGMGTAAETIVIEEFMEGEEASVFALCDGKDYIVFAPAQDHKRVFDGDRGKNTGGMGAYAPAPIVTPEMMRTIEESIIQPTLSGMAQEDRAYTGCLYVGLMITADGPKVVEYNSRFGDPETQVVLPLLEGDLVDILEASCHGSVRQLRGQTSHGSPEGASVCVVLASGGYPDGYRKGYRISGLDRVRDMAGIVVFHAGTRKEKDAIVTAGGRVLGVTATLRNRSLREAIDAAYNAVGEIVFSDMHYRKDIGQRGLKQR
jgi:phosphoribosylamine---glycine ligase